MNNAYFVIDGENVALIFDQSVVRFNKSDLEKSSYSRIVDKVFEEYSVKLAHSGEKVEKDNLKESLEKKASMVPRAVAQTVTSAQSQFDIPEDTTLFRSKTGSFCIEDYTPPGEEDPGKTIQPGDYIDISTINTESVKRAIRAGILVPTTLEECAAIRAKYNKDKERRAGAARDPKGVSRDSGLTMSVGGSQELLERASQSSSTISFDVDDSGGYDEMSMDSMGDDDLVNF